MTFDKPRLPRLAEAHELRRLKSATEQALKLAGLTEFEERTRVKKAVLSKYLTEEPEGEQPHFMPLDIILEVDRHNGAPIVTSALAGMLGFRLVPTAEVEAAEVGYNDVHAISKETADVVNLLFEFLMSGRRLDAATRKELLRELTEAKQVLYRLAQKIAGGGQG